MNSQDEFLSVFLKYQREIRASIASAVRDVSVRDDLFQETAMILWRTFDRYDATRPFDSWARGVVRNVVLQHWRKAGKAALQLEPAALDAVMEAYEETREESGLMEEALQRCLQKLSSHARQLLELRYQMGLALAEMAERLKSNLNAVNQALLRTRAALQRCIEGRQSLAEREGAPGA